MSDVAFVPNHEHDLFLSYARDESAWVIAFQAALADEFYVRTGQKLKFWRDVQDIHLGQDWTDEIRNAILRSAAFVAILSPIYFERPICADERDFFLKDGLESVKVESFHRFLKVVKTPGPGKAHLDLYDTLEPIRFFDKPDSKGFPAGSPEFNAMIGEAFRHISEILRFMANRCQEVYIAPGASAMYDEREGLIHELKVRGFNIQPKVRYGPGFKIDAIRKDMEKVSHLVFLFGDEYVEFTGTQVQLACDLNKPVIAWIRPGAKHDAIRDRFDALGKLPESSEILGGATLADLRPHLLDKLRPPKPTAPYQATAPDAPVYVNFDASADRDRALGANIAGIVGARGYPVILGEGETNHGHFMRTSKAVLLFRPSHPKSDYWLRYLAEELPVAKQKFERQSDFAAKAILAANPGLLQPSPAGVDLIPYSEPFNPSLLDPFFAKLHAARSPHGA